VGGRWANGRGNKTLTPMPAGTGLKKSYATAGKVWLLGQIRGLLLRPSAGEGCRLKNALDAASLKNPPSLDLRGS